MECMKEEKCHAQLGETNITVGRAKENGVQENDVIRYVIVAPRYIIIFKCHRRLTAAKDVTR